MYISNIFTIFEIMNIDLNNNILKGKFTTTLQVISGYLQQYNNSNKNNHPHTSNEGVYNRFEHVHNQLLADLETLANEYDFIDNLKNNMSMILEDKTLTDTQKINFIKKLNGQ